MYVYVTNGVVNSWDLLGLILSTPTTPGGIAALGAVGGAISVGSINAAANAVFGDECDFSGLMSVEQEFSVDCERTCKRKHWYSLPCFSKDGQGIRKGKMVCRGWIQQTWEFHSWVGEASQCSAEECGSCCEDRGIEYEQTRWGSGSLFACFAVKILITTGFEQANVIPEKRQKIDYF